MVSKMMEDVWRWKEEVAKETQEMTIEEEVAYFRQAEQRLVDKTGGKPLNLRQEDPRQRAGKQA